LVAIWGGDKCIAELFSFELNGSRENELAVDPKLDHWKNWSRQAGQAGKMGRSGRQGSRSRLAL